MTMEELESKINELETKTRRLEDTIEIMNLQSRYNYYMELNYENRIASELFAQKDPNVKCEICDSGVFEGIESVKRLWSAMQEGNKIRGFLGTVMISTPHIQISTDGKTARGMWHAFGPNSLPATVYPCEQQNLLTAIWLLGKYDNEYVKEDGKWKIRSLRVVVFFRASYEHGWIKQPDVRRFGMPPWECKADKPSTMFKQYHPHGYNVFLPEPPDPLD